MKRRSQRSDLNVRDHCIDAFPEQKIGGNVIVSLPMSQRVQDRRLAHRRHHRIVQLAPPSTSAPRHRDVMAGIQAAHLLDHGGEAVTQSARSLSLALEVFGQVEERAESHAAVVLAVGEGSVGVLGEDEAAQLDAEDVGRGLDGEAAVTGGVVEAGLVATLHVLHLFCREAGADTLGKLTVGVVGEGHPVRVFGGDDVGCLLAYRTEE